MSITYISVPDLHDSFSRVVLDNIQYLIRFTYNSNADIWTFGLYTTQKEPIIEGVRVVPQFPLTLHIVDDRMPDGVFGAYSKLDTIGRRDFIEGRARFAYIQNISI